MPAYPLGPAHPFAHLHPYIHPHLNLFGHGFMPPQEPAQPRVAVGQRGMHKYPTISSWLGECEGDLERGRDQHQYSKLAPVFADNGCTRIDDVARMTPELIMNLATDSGVIVTIGLVNRIHGYAVDDVARIRNGGIAPL